MTQPILIIKNITREGPGILQALLEEGAIAYQAVDLEKGESFPDPSDYSAIVVLGGPDSANDETEKMRNELQKIREVIELGKPYLGICLGLQALVKATGGKVVKNPTKEVGFIDPEGGNFKIQLTETGQSDPLFRGLADNFKVFHLHGETVEIKGSMTLLGTGKFCKNQIVKISPNAYGIQCHFELTTEMFDVWVNEDPDLLVLNKEKLKNDFEAIKKEYDEVGKKLFLNFLKIAGFLRP